MKKVVFIFATGDIWLDRLVTWFTRSPWSHVAFRFVEDDLLVEALAGRGLLIQPGGKYDKWSGGKKQIYIEVSSEAYVQMLELACFWRNQKIPYGYVTCLAIGINNLFGEKWARLFLDFWPNKEKKHLICSEMIVDLWRVADPFFLQGKDSRLISPDDLLKSLLEAKIAYKIDKPRECAYNC